MKQPLRAIDDPARLARTARIMRSALKRRDSLEDHVKRIVDSAPPLTQGQRARLGALLLSSGSAAMTATPPPPAKRATRRPAAPVRRGTRDASTISRFLAEEIASARLTSTQPLTHGAADPVATDALEVFGRMRSRGVDGYTWEQAYAEARARAAESRRIDEERRRTHADDHFWCVYPECPSAVAP